MIKEKNITIIAEAGVNHNGQMDIARKLIDAAADAGADFVKFQAFKADLLVSREARKADYQIKNIGNEDDRQYNMLKKLEIDETFHRHLMQYCEKRNIGFLSSPFDEQGIDMLYRLGIRTFKVPSGEITNLPYLEKLGALHCRVILSTGMADLSEIKHAIDVLVQFGTEKKQITVLHCNTDYPTKFEDVNLLAMSTIAKELSVESGYSDHTLGIEIPVAAAALGASVIEKHFTLCRNLEGPDHKASLEPSELTSMVHSIRHIEKALGSGVKKPSDSEKKNRDIVRKSVHLAKSLKKGDSVSADDIIMLRPGDGISPMSYKEILGRRLRRDLRKGHKLERSDLVY